MDDAESQQKIAGILLPIHHLDEAKCKVSSEALQLCNGENKVTAVPWDRKPGVLLSLVLLSCLDPSTQ